MYKSLVNKERLYLFNAINNKKYDIVEKICREKISDEHLKIGMLQAIKNAVLNFDFTAVKIISKYCAFPEVKPANTNVILTSGKMLEILVNGGEKAFAITIEPDRFLYELAKVKRQMKIEALNG